RAVQRFIGHVGRERKIDPGEVVRRELPLRPVDRGVAPRTIANRPRLEARALGARRVHQVVGIADAREADARVVAHVAVLAGSRGSAPGALAVRPGDPLAVGVAEALEVLAPRRADHIAAEEADVVAGA